MHEHLTQETQDKIQKYRLTHIDFWDEQDALLLINAFEDIQKQKSQVNI